MPHNPILKWISLVFNLLFYTMMVVLKFGHVLESSKGLLKMHISWLHHTADRFLIIVHGLMPVFVKMFPNPCFSNPYSVFK